MSEPRTTPFWSTAALLRDSTYHRQRRIHISKSLQSFIFSIGPATADIPSLAAAILTMPPVTTPDNPEEFGITTLIVCDPASCQERTPKRGDMMTQRSPGM